tara:strand:- start:205 stop:390 length:186 start_codon:yes stop_codon:yes gene_type:complete
MNPKICGNCGKWFPGLGDIMYHLDKKECFKKSKDEESTKDADTSKCKDKQDDKQDDKQENK